MLWLPGELDYQLLYDIMYAIYRTGHGQYQLIAGQDVLVSQNK